VILANDRNLKLFTRAEVGEDARLAHLRDFGERADGQPFEAHVRRQRQGGLEDRGASLLPLEQRALRGRWVADRGHVVVWHSGGDGASGREIERSFYFADFLGNKSVRGGLFLGCGA